MKKKTSTSFLAMIIKLSAIIWITSIIAFVIVIGLGTKWFTGTSQDTQFGNSSSFLVFLVGSIGIGSLAFGLLVLAVIFRIVLSNKLIAFEKSFKGIILFIPKFIFLMAFLPLLLLWRIFRKREIKIIEKLAQAGIVIIVLFPVWVGGYWTMVSIAAYQLGYVPEDKTIVGTGSMYPTWTKGSKGKGPKELAKEIVGTAGFLKYPNGVVIFGNRILGHTIGRGDIVTAENEEIRKAAEKIYGSPSGVMKRVIAISGDTVEIRDGILYLNNQPQKEPYIAKPRSTFGESFLHECKKFTVPNDSVFLMGDNRKGSGDSREFGPVKYSEVDYVLPFAKQKGSLDKNWHDTTNDLADTAKPKIDRVRFVELLNQKRKENGIEPVRYEPKLEKSAAIRGEYLLKYNSFDKAPSYEVITAAMAKTGYWNSYVWEWPIQGYYEADELIEDYLERDWTEAKDTWFDKKFDDIGIAEFQGSLNGCPTQIIVVHAAGYIPATYDSDVVDSWRASVDNLNSIIPSWENAKGKSWVNKEDLNKLLSLLYQERGIASRILAKMESKQWLTKEDDNLINEYKRMTEESSALANKLNTR